MGSGMVAPTLLTQVKPRYTADALRQRIQGTVTLEVVVSREGIPVAIRVIVHSIRDWTRRPSLRHASGASHPVASGSTPVDVLVTIVLDFSVR